MYGISHKFFLDLLQVSLWSSWQIEFDFLLLFHFQIRHVSYNMDYLSKAVDKRGTEKSTEKMNETLS